MTDIYINLTAASRLLGVSSPTVLKLIRCEKLTAVKTGNKHRLLRSEVVKLSQEGWIWDVQ